MGYGIVYALNSPVVPEVRDAIGGGSLLSDPCAPGRYLLSARVVSRLV